jgi:cell division cycle 14
MVPVTPSKHVAAASACARTAPPPGQPWQKTPNTKQVATDSSNDEMEDESNDVLPALGAALLITCHK